MAANLSAFSLGLLRQGIEDSFNTLPLWLIILEAIVMITAAFCNMMVIYSGLSSKTTKRSTFYLLLMNHTCANLILSAIIYPGILFKLSVGFSQNEMEAKYCQYNAFCMLWLETVALLTNGFVAVNRALSCHPLLSISTLLRSPKATIVAVIIIWLTGFMIYVIPVHLYSDSWKTSYVCYSVEDVLEAIIWGKSDTVLEYEPTASVVFIAFSSTLVATFVVNVTSYAVIVKYLLQGHGTQAAEATQGRTQAYGSKQRRKEKRRALVVIVLLFLTLLTCWLPFLIVLHVDPGLLNENWVFLALVVVESLLDPILYMSTMPALRPRWLVLKNGQRRTRPEMSADTDTMDKGQTSMTRVD